MYETFEEWIDAELHPLLTGHAITADLKDLTDEEIVRAWVLLRHAGDAITARLEAIRERLLKEAEEFGKETDKGGQRVYIDNCLVLREKRVAKLPTKPKFMELMEKANLNMDQAFSKVTQTVLDPSKIENLVNLGKLSRQDVEDLKKVTWALRVKPAESLETVLDEAFGDGDEELPDVQPREKRSSAEGSRKGEWEIKS
jgi:hypothetical protein